MTEVSRQPRAGATAATARRATVAVTGAAALRERAAAVHRRRAMLHAEEARAKIYALKRKGEVRAQALLRSCVAGAVSEDDIKAAAEAFEAGAAGVGGGRGTGRGVVIAGGAPRSTLESWNEQRRTKAEEIRLQGAMEEAFKSLEGVAALRRQDAVGARRDRARESNARAEEGHGRACKRARMQAESKAARVEARAREAQEMAAAATSAAAPLERERERKRDKAEAARATPSGREKEKKKERTRVGERKGRERMSPSPLFQPAASGDAEKNGTALVPPPKLGGGKEWKEAVASVVGGGKEGRGKETGRGESARRGRLHANEVGGRREVWVPSPAREVTPLSRRQRRVGDGGGEREAEQMAGWAEREEDSEEEDEKGTRKETGDDRAMWQRIKHLDRVAARLEGAEAGIEAKLDLIAKGGWSGRVARSSRRDSRPVYAEANAWEWGGGDGNRAKSAGAREEEIRWKRDDAVAYSPRRRPLRVARERRKPKSSPSVGRLTAPTVSSKNKSKPGASGGMAGAEGRCSKSPTKWRRASPGGKGRRVEYFEEAVGGAGAGEGNRATEWERRRWGGGAGAGAAGRAEE
eukprot:jgi/Undpi1/2182/HiC_scaffold_12.g05568.m1